MRGDGLSSTGSREIVRSVIDWYILRGTVDVPQSSPTGGSLQVVSTVSPYPIYSLTNSCPLEAERSFDMMMGAGNKIVNGGSTARAPI